MGRVWQNEKARLSVSMGETRNNTARTCRWGSLGLHANGERTSTPDRAHGVLTDMTRSRTHTSVLCMVLCLASAVHYATETGHDVGLTLHPPPCV